MKKREGGDHHWWWSVVALRRSTEDWGVLVVVVLPEATRARAVEKTDRKKTHHNVRSCQKKKIGGWERTTLLPAVCALPRSVWFMTSVVALCSAHCPPAA